MNTDKKGSATLGGATKNEVKTTAAPAVQKSNSTVTAHGIEEIKPEKIKVLSVEDRKGRNEIFGNLLKKHDHIKETNQKLEAFVVGSDENSQTLTLKDAKGNLFNTGNPVVIKEVIQKITAQVSNQIVSVEEEILNFVI